MRTREDAARSDRPGRRIDAADVVALLSEIYPTGVWTRHDADDLVALDASLGIASSHWTDYLAATLAGYVLDRWEPHAIVDSGKLAWLTSRFRLEHGGASAAGLETVLRVLEAARYAPASLAVLALRQVRDFGDVSVIARILRAGGGAAGAPVSREEAEALLELHRTRGGAPANSEFDDLLVRAVAHHLAAAAGLPVPPRPRAFADARRRFAWSRRATEDLPYGRLGPEQQEWLANRIRGGEKRGPADRALLHLCGRATGARPSSMGHAA